MGDEERLVKLEELAAHQAKVIEELSDQLAGQWRAIEQMRTKLDRLTERFLELEEAAREAAPITRPPHY
ncbi:SlyX protein [Xaviernesmea oryzae]|uniref:Protein SlyX homolog n=1 Tax=Xaviernesmea oryzae TaxID=464029 RepID=A0A1X7ES27_9HYPH|nr:SlyX family protein [Xaviernesmea oryzae]SMF38379.1 SlyX protein [Xaviernesmea oryzae]